MSRRKATIPGEKNPSNSYHTERQGLYFCDPGSPFSPLSFLRKLLYEDTELRKGGGLRVGLFGVSSASEQSRIPTDRDRGATSKRICKSNPSIPGSLYPFSLVRRLDLFFRNKEAYIHLRTRPGAPARSCRWSCSRSGSPPRRRRRKGSRPGRGETFTHVTSVSGERKFSLIGIEN